MLVNGTWRIGVLALQGAFRAHQQRLTDLGVEAPLVRLPDHLDRLDGLVMPGGESTTMSKLLTSSGLFDEIKARLSDGFPVLGTCAGLILLASDVRDARPDQRSFGSLDITVRRNAYGRQVDSFEADLDVRDLGDEPFHGIFIRAPVIESVGPAIKVLAELDSAPVLVEHGAIMGATFHPELSPDSRIHQRFADRIREFR